MNDPQNTQDRLSPLVRIADTVVEIRRRRFRDDKVVPIPGVRVTITRDGRLATLWADPTDNRSRITNPLTTAADGSYAAWVVPGDYTLEVFGITHHIRV